MNGAHRSKAILYLVRHPMRDGGLSKTHRLNAASFRLIYGKLHLASTTWESSFVCILARRNVSYPSRDECFFICFLRTAASCTLKTALLECPPRVRRIHVDIDVEIDVRIRVVHMKKLPSTTQLSTQLLTLLSTLQPTLLAWSNSLSFLPTHCSRSLVYPCRM